MRKSYAAQLVLVCCIATAIFALGVCVGAFVLPVFSDAEGGVPPPAASPSSAPASVSTPPVQTLPAAPTLDENTTPEPSEPPATTAGTETEAPTDDGADPDINALLDSMTPHEKICQMFIVLPDALTGVSGTTVAGEITKSALEKYPVGGLIYLSSNITSAEQIKKFNETVQSYSRVGMFLAVDEEGGRVGRLKSSLGAHTVGAMFNYKDDGEDIAFQNAVTLSEALKKHGFNMDFAPVADVWSNPQNSVIGDRAYSDDFEQAAILVGAAVRGFKLSNIIAVAKHFPGHGNTSEDSHYGSAYVDKTLDELRAAEFLPFEAAIKSGADMVMLGHLIVRDIDERPATMSRAIIADILRDELGFDGVIVTDALNMQAMSDHFSVEDIAVGAVQAGVDILLTPKNLEKAVSAIEDAVDNDIITMERINQSVMRILAVKKEHGILL
ncbi:MAG: glycoside hydrolase family 3 protein [Oscillospiraceae bacterium]|jgi:beta-N-acetylhexosaminidase|nr:glycoside hydrolase family 3 protein [Oscillospiraceae bacterium]